MCVRKQMNEMSNEELNKIACCKDKKGNATKEARRAQELIWERRFYTREAIRDDYTGLFDIYDECYQEYLDYYN